MTPVRLLSDLAPGDWVLTPCRRLAVVQGFEDGRVRFAYDDGDEGLALAHWLKLVSRASQRPLAVSRICESQKHGSPDPRRQHYFKSLVEKA